MFYTFLARSLCSRPSPTPRSVLEATGTAVVCKRLSALDLVERIERISTLAALETAANRMGTSALSLLPAPPSQRFYHTCCRSGPESLHFFAMEFAVVLTLSLKLLAGRMRKECKLLLAAANWILLQHCATEVSAWLVRTLVAQSRMRGARSLCGALRQPRSSSGDGFTLTRIQGTSKRLKKKQQSVHMVFCSLRRGGPGFAFAGWVAMGH